MKVARAEIPGSDHLPRVINPPGLGAGREKRCRIDVLHAAVTVQKFLGIEVRVGITPVQISCLTAFPTLKSLGIAQLWAWTCSYASAQAEVSASRGLVRLLSELLGHIPLKSMSLPQIGLVLSNCCLPGDFKLLRIVMHPGQGRRGLKRIVQPRPQIAIEEQLLPQQRGQRR